MKIAKHTFALFIIYLISLTFASQTNVATEAYFKLNSNSSNKQIGSSELNQMIKGPGKDQGLQAQQIYGEGWVKFFHYKSNAMEKPSSFFVNPSFDEFNPSASPVSGTVPIAGASTQSAAVKTNSTDIPDQTSFYAVIYADSVNLLQKKDNAITQLYDAMMIDYIQPIDETDVFKGGVQDVGNFSEGYCFRVLTVAPQGQGFRMKTNEPAPKNGYEEVWFFCMTRPEQKKTFMDTIIQIKLAKQKEIGYFAAQEQKNNPFNNNNSGDPTAMDNTMGADGVVKNKSGNLNDGYWKILKDFGECSLACGGGTQTLQRMCIPPKKGGKPCIGDAIVVKKCNIQPCPKVETMSEVAKKPNEIIEKPVVKIMQISSRPQRYDKCYLKESDAFMVKNDNESAEFGALPRIPVRLVMNNKSLSAYQDESLKNNLVTFILDNSNFAISKQDPSCFIITGGKSNTAFCRLDSSKSTNFVDEWYYDFNLFKNQCKQEKATVELDADEEKKLQNEFKNQMIQIKNDLLNKRQKKLKEKMVQSENNGASKDLEKTQQLSLMAIQKELKLEELLEKEERERENDEINNLEVELEEEKKKKECLLQSIKEKELEDQYNVQKSQIQDQIEQIKKDAQVQIEIKRNNMRSKIEQMRKRNSRKLNKLRQQMMTVRMEAANTLGQSSKNGDMSKCFKGSEAQRDAIDAYCTENFMDDIAQNSQCKSIEDFCQICCENEFGELHIDKRDQCMKQCDDPVQPKEGNWIYVTKLE